MHACWRHDAEMGVHRAPLGLCLSGLSEEALAVEAGPDLRDRLTRLGLNVLVTDSASRQPCLMTA